MFFVIGEIRLFHFWLISIIRQYIFFKKKCSSDQFNVSDHTEQSVSVPNVCLPSSRFDKLLSRRMQRTHYGKTSNVNINASIIASCHVFPTVQIRASVRVCLYVCFYYLCVKHTRCLVFPMRLLFTSSIVLSLSFALLFFLCMCAFSFFLSYFVISFYSLANGIKSLCSLYSNHNINIIWLSFFSVVIPVCCWSTHRTIAWNENSLPCKLHHHHYRYSSAKAMEIILLHYLLVKRETFLEKFQSCSICRHGLLLLLYTI